MSSGYRDDGRIREGSATRNYVDQGRDEWSGFGSTAQQPIIGKEPQRVGMVYLEESLEVLCTGIACTEQAVNGLRSFLGYEPAFPPAEPTPSKSTTSSDGRVSIQARFVGEMRMRVTDIEAAIRDIVERLSC